MTSSDNPAIQNLLDQIREIDKELAGYQARKNELENEIAYLKGLIEGRKQILELST